MPQAFAESKKFTPISLKLSSKIQLNILLAASTQKIEKSDMDIFGNDKLNLFSELREKTYLKIN